MYLSNQLSIYLQVQVMFSRFGHQVKVKYVIGHKYLMRFFCKFFFNIITKQVPSIQARKMCNIASQLILIKNFNTFFPV